MLFDIILSDMVNVTNQQPIKIPANFQRHFTNNPSNLLEHGTNIFVNG